MYPPPHMTHMCACMSAGNESQLLPGGGQGCGKLPVGCTAPQVTHTCILLLMYMWQASFWMYCPPSDRLDVLPPTCGKAVRERESESERASERDRQTDRQRGRQRERERERERDVRINLRTACNLVGPKSAEMARFRVLLLSLTPSPGSLLGGK